MNNETVSFTSFFLLCSDIMSILPPFQGSKATVGPYKGVSKVTKSQTSSAALTRMDPVEMLVLFICDIKRNLTCCKHPEDVCVVCWNGTHQQYTANNFANHTRLLVSVPLDILFTKLSFVQLAKTLSVTSNAVLSQLKLADY